MRDSGEAPQPTGAGAVGVTRYLIGLAPRERDTLDGLARGMRISEVARLLGVSPITVRTNFHRAKTKLGARTVKHAVAIYARFYATDLTARVA